MATDLEPSKRSTHSRRAILGGAAAGAAALGIRAIAGPEAVRGGTNPPIRVNQGNTVTDFTSIDGPGDSQVFFAFDTLTMGVQSHVQEGIGVSVSADGTDSTAIEARTAGLESQIAIYAIGNTDAGEGYALKAETKDGIALYGSAVGGYALQVQGIAVFSRAGGLSIDKGSRSQKLTLTGHGNYLTTSSFVVATIQGDVAGTWVRACSVNVNANSFTVRLNKAAPKSLSVGLIVIN